VDEVEATRPHKSIKFTVNLWTNNIATDPRKIVPGHAWFQGMIHVQANPVHRIPSQGDPIPFNSPEEFQLRFEEAARKAGVTLHYPGEPAVIG
jgi:hypothetical protein